MPQTIPDRYRDLFAKRAFASLSTLMPDGSPQVSSVWSFVRFSLSAYWPMTSLMPSGCRIDQLVATSRSIPS